MYKRKSGGATQMHRFLLNSFCSLMLQVFSEFGKPAFSFLRTKHEELSTTQSQDQHSHYALQDNDFKALYLRAQLFSLSTSTLKMFNFAYIL